MKKLFISLVIGIALMTSMASAATQITGITTSARNTWHITEASALASTNREVGEQYMAPKWDATPFPEFYGSSESADAWVMFDLGAEYDLDEIRLWNANIAHGNAGLMGWYSKNMSIHVASDDAALPSMDAGLGNYFTDASWTSIWDGDLAQGPGGTDIARDELVDPQLILDATGNNGVRYVAIDVDSRYDGANHAIALMGHIQIYGVPSDEIAVISAIRTGLDFVEFEVTDVRASELLPGTVSLSLDGNDVTAELSVDKDGGVTTIRHEQNPQFLFGTTIMYEFSAMDSIGQDVEQSGEFKTQDPDITVSSGLNFLEFNIRDIGVSALQPGTISVTIEGTNVTGGLTVNKVGDVTTVHHDEVPQFAVGATVNYIFAGEDSLGQMIQLDDSFMVEAPFFPFQEELLGAEEMAVDGNWGVRYLFGAGTLNTLETVIDVISQAAADPDNFAGTIVDTSEPFMNHSANGSPSLILPDLPYHPDAVAAGLGVDDFILYGIGYMRIKEAGTYTIGVHSDDGFAFRVHGWTFTESFGGDSRDGRNGTIDLGSPDTIIHPSVTGDSNTRAVAANVQPGIYRVEFCWWERGGGDHGEIYIAKGRFPNDGDTTEWLPIGSQESGGIQLVTKGETFGETLRITEIIYDEANDEFTISWTSRDNQTYALFYSDDGKLDFDADVDDSVISTGDTTSLTFSNPAPDARKLFFRISESGP